MSARKVSKNPVADRLADALFDKLQNQGAAPETSQDLENLFGAMMGRLLNRMLEGTANARHLLQATLPGFTNHR